ncbi:uncharacterized protein BO66DRAFT_93845 [Aspergillus aculeatinus CBS 121060]|uniref:Uncharacterized protein n=1 Tax=Aspergillus aculeatinus CBS 121060 TaxID=1448322 RepID=A0ACD1H8P0_9EURO|nr:hypothetical protein BO66DRAFT_93845 [Aspergillus aculeatinus CBS 121060]RAH70005.1 hypothetical protein BO66DRAFT_93845 [Aspergillus aculeatinus CBS 121060]
MHPVVATLTGGCAGCIFQTFTELELLLGEPSSQGRIIDMQPGIANLSCQHLQPSVRPLAYPNLTNNAITVCLIELRWIVEKKKKFVK